MSGALMGRIESRWYQTFLKAEYKNARHGWHGGLAV